MAWWDGILPRRMFFDHGGCASCFGALFGGHPKWAKNEKTKYFFADGRKHLLGDALFFFFWWGTPVFGLNSRLDIPSHDGIWS